MDAILKAVVLAIVEGATEFLPVSSTGHLILVEAFLDLTDDANFNNTFLIAIQLPAILAVLVYFWDRLWPFERTGAPRRVLFALWAKIVLAVVPALLLGPFLDDFLETHLFAPVPVAIALVVGGIILIAVERRAHRVRYEDVADIGIRTALLIGVFQCLAMIPGTSRSAATIIGAMLLGTGRAAAAEFSFFLAIPTLFAATVYSLLKSGTTFSGEEWMLLGVGSVVSFIVAYMAIAAFMQYIKRRSFAAFGYYRIALGTLVLVAAWMGWFAR